MVILSLLTRQEGSAKKKVDDNVCVNDIRIVEAQANLSPLWDLTTFRDVLEILPMHILVVNCDEKITLSLTHTVSGCVRQGDFLELQVQFAQQRFLPRSHHDETKHQQ